MGEVFLGQSPGGRLVAVKLIRGELAADREFRVRFAREVAAARHVSGMFTAPVVDADLDAPRPWLVTAYVPGPSLAEAVDSQGPLPLGSVLTLAAGLAEGLEAIHAEGMVHRDLKPSNVLLASDGPRIIDFGISRAADATALTRANIFVGSPGYMSPEQALGEEVGPASDMFSLGAVLTFAAVGASPFGDGTVTTLLYRVAHDRPATERLPGQLRPLVERCLAKDPHMRPTPDQLLTEVGAVDSGTNWLPQPVAETLIGYARPVAGTTIPPAQPSPPPAPLGPGPRYLCPRHLSPPQASRQRRSRPCQRPCNRPRLAGLPSGAACAGACHSRRRALPSSLPRPALGRETSLRACTARDRHRSGQTSAVSPARRRRWDGDPTWPAPHAAADGWGGCWPPEHWSWCWPGRASPRSRSPPGCIWGASQRPPPPPPPLPRARGPWSRRTSPPSTPTQWRKVWNLGGKNFSQTYGQMVAGYRSTAHDVLTSIHAHGHIVTVRLKAHHTDGTVLTYRISYTVQDGVITGAHAKLLR